MWVMGFPASSLVSGIFLPGLTSAPKRVPQGVKFLQSQIQGSHSFQLSFTLEEISFVKLQLLKKTLACQRMPNKHKILIQETR